MGKKKNYINYLFIIILLIYIFLYRFFIFSNYLKYSESITSAFLILLFCFSIVIYGFKNAIYSEYKKKVLKNVLITIGVYFLIIYFLGLVTGFLSNSYSLTIKSVLNNVLFQAIIISMIELFRWNFINYNKKNTKIIVLLTIVIALFEINLSFKTDYLDSINSLFKFVTTIVLPISFKNYLCSYLTYHTDFEASLFYSLIMGLYKYIVPIEPDLDYLLLSVINIFMPFIIVMNISRYTFNLQEASESVTNKKYIKKSDAPFYIIITVLIILVFGIGPYKLVGIKSGSMTPKINIGDAVLIFKNVKKVDLKVNDIIAYESEDKEIVVHRIIKINKDGTYTTKGDYNNTADSKYVDFKQVKGIVKFKIPYIAYPAVYFKRR